MSPFISAYREGYSSEHVLVRLIEEWRKTLDDDYIVEGCSHGPVQGLRLHPTQSFNC